MMGEGGLWSHWLLPPLGILLALLMARCGSGEAVDHNSAAFKRLNAACAAHNRRAAARLFEVYDEPRVKRADSEGKAINLEVEFILPILLADAESQARAFRAFDAPPEDRKRVDAILDAYRAWISKARRSPQKTVLENNTYNKARNLAGTYGLADCKASPFGF